MGRDGGAQGGRHRLPRWAVRLIAALVLLFGIGLLVWPWVLDQFESQGVGSTVSKVTAETSALPEDQKAWDFEEARSYNAVLAGETPELADADIVPYEEQLAFESDPMMSWIEIPSIDVSMPIYHGTTDAVLTAGVGHLEGTSLPVGGASTHAVLTAHSGLRNLRMFDDIRNLQQGDIVLLHTMGDILAYKVTSTEVVWPDETESLAIRPGEDLLTLVTCTPYGVNDHRLLVHCERCDYEPEAVQEASELQNRHWGAREWAVLLAIAAAIAFALDILIHHRRSKTELKKPEGRSSKDGQGTLPPGRKKP